MFLKQLFSVVKSFSTLNLSDIFYDMMTISQQDFIII